MSPADKRSQIMIDTDNQARLICIENQARMAKEQAAEHKRREMEQVTENIVKTFDEAHAPKPLTPQEKAARTKAKHQAQAKILSDTEREKIQAQAQVEQIHKEQALLKEAQDGLRKSRQR